MELKGEEVINLQPVVGYLHTGIEKSCEYRTWVQGVTFVTRMDYLAPIFNETAYCLAVEKLVGIEAPPRAQALRVLMMELNRISSHLVWLATTGLELGALSIMLYGFREREEILDILEDVTGLRMNHAWVRPAGVSQDLPDGTEDKIRAFVRDMRQGRRVRDPAHQQPDLAGADQGHRPDPRRADRLGTTGPMLWAAGLDHPRKAEPYCGYEQYEFTVPTATGSDVYARYQVRLAEMRESLRIVEQVLDSLPGGPVMSTDPKIGWPAKLALGPDGLGNSPAHVQHIMGESMEALIHHFKQVTEGIKVPRGEVYVPGVAQRRARTTRLRRRQPALPGARPRPVVRQPPDRHRCRSGRWSPTSSPPCPPSTRSSAASTAEPIKEPPPSCPCPTRPCPGPRS